MWIAYLLKKENNLVELRKMPADAVPDKKDYNFFYKKMEKKKNFTIKDLPDSSWEFVSRQDFIVEKGKDNEPPVKDFYLTTLSGNDTTEAVLSLMTSYYLFFVKDICKDTDYWFNNFIRIYQWQKSQKHVFVHCYSQDGDSQ